MDKASPAGANRVIGRLHAEGALDRDEENRCGRTGCCARATGARPMRTGPARGCQGAVRGSPPLLDNGGRARSPAMVSDWHVDDVRALLSTSCPTQVPLGRVAQSAVQRSPWCRRCRCRIHCCWRLATIGSASVPATKAFAPNSALRGTRLHSGRRDRGHRRAPPARRHPAGWHALEGAFDAAVEGCAWPMVAPAQPGRWPGVASLGDLWLDDVAVSRRTRSINRINDLRHGAGSHTLPQNPWKIKDRYGTCAGHRGGCGAGHGHAGWRMRRTPPRHRSRTTEAATPGIDKGGADQPWRRTPPPPPPGSAWSRRAGRCRRMGSHHHLRQQVPRETRRPAGVYDVDHGRCAIAWWDWQGAGIITGADP